MAGLISLGASVLCELGAKTVASATEPDLRICRQAQVSTAVSRFGLQGGFLAALGQANWCLSQAESASPDPES